MHSIKWDINDTVSYLSCSLLIKQTNIVDFDEDVIELLCG